MKERPATAVSSDTLCFVVAGELAIVVESPGERDDEAKLPREAWCEYLGWFEPGDLFSDGYCDVAGKDTGRVLDCVASTEVALLAIDGRTLAVVMQQHPEWGMRLAQTMARLRQRFLSHQEPTRRLVQDFYLRHGFASSRRIRVGETTHCLDCARCEAPCANRHGHARMSRVHARLGRLAFHRLCLNCLEQPCLKSCAFGGRPTTASLPARSSCLPMIWASRDRSSPSRSSCHGTSCATFWLCHG
jgi:hypothetical protein